MNFLTFGEFWGGQLGGMASLGVDYVSIVVSLGWTAAIGLGLAFYIY